MPVGRCHCPPAGGGLRRLPFEVRVSGRGDRTALHDSLSHRARRGDSGLKAAACDVDLDASERLAPTQHRGPWQGLDLQDAADSAANILGQNLVEDCRLLGLIASIRPISDLHGQLDRKLSAERKRQCSLAITASVNGPIGYG